MFLEISRNKRSKIYHFEIFSFRSSTDLTLIRSYIISGKSLFTKNLRYRKQRTFIRIWIPFAGSRNSIDILFMNIAMLVQFLKHVFLPVQESGIVSRFNNGKAWAIFIEIGIAHAITEQLWLIYVSRVEETTRVRAKP